MKHSHISYILAIVIMIAATGCDKDFDRFGQETTYITAPSEVNSITSEALAGQILLRWDVPADSNYYFLQVGYYDYRTKKDVYKIFSVYLDSLLVDNTRTRYGDYNFTFQTFNRKNQGSEVQTVKARSGAATITETITKAKIALTGSQISTNAQEPTEGPVTNLVDGSTGTFFHSAWSVSIAYPHYIQIDFAEEHENFQFVTVNRVLAWSVNPPEIVEVQISDDNANWETIQTVNGGIATGSGAEYTSDIFRPGKKFTHFRYNVLRANGYTWWNMSEFVFYDVNIYTYDPETDEVEE